MKRRRTALLLVLSLMAASPLAAVEGQLQGKEAIDAKIAAIPERQAGFKALVAGDAKTARVHYQAYYDQLVKAGLDVQRVEGAAGFLAIVNACLQDQAGAGQVLEKLMRDLAAAGLDDELPTYWNGLYAGLIYGGLGQAAKAEESFRTASRAIDQTSSKEAWVPAGKLAPRWFLTRVYRAQNKTAEAQALEAELAPLLKKYRGQYPPAIPANLAVIRRYFLFCGWMPPVEEIEAFAKAVDAKLLPRVLAKDGR